LHANTFIDTSIKKLKKNNPIIHLIVAEDISIQACKQKQKWTDFLL